jgi:hypothetical protein
MVEQERLLAAVDLGRADRVRRLRAALVGAGGGLFLEGGRAVLEGIEARELYGRVRGYTTTSRGLAVEESRSRSPGGGLLALVEC